MNKKTIPCRPKLSVRKKEKLHWASMEMTRVKLNPEQAVLSCCDSSSKAELNVITQCFTTFPTCVGLAIFEQSS